MRQVTLTTPSGTTELRVWEGSGVPVLFLPGHTSTFTSKKLAQMVTICTKLGRPLLCPAYYGWDGSVHAEVPEGGKGYIRHWMSQLLDLLDTYCTVPHLLVGHSMGGILMLQLARRRPDKVAGLIGIAAGFGANGQARASEIYGNSDFMGLKNHTPLQFTPNGKAMVFAPGSFDFKCPVRLQYGLQDDVIDWHNGANIAAACTGDDVQVWLNKAGTHAMDDAASLGWLENSIKELS
jgi:pimeloyl-ACP methyl ester carboxylesterase